MAKTVHAHPTPSMALDENAIASAARERLHDGAVTPSIAPYAKDICKLLNDALATEWVCVLRYYRHYYSAKGMLVDAVKGEFLEHAQQELAHANRIAERIVQLGGEPDYNPATLLARSHADYDDSADLKAMIKANLIAERVAVEVYSQMIDLVGDKDPTTRRMLEEILADEQEHADELADWM